MLKSLVVSLLLIVGQASIATAQAAPDAAAQPPAWMSMMPIVFMFAIFYLLIFRPQQKKEKTRLEFIKALKRGDEVVTSSGMFGRVEGLTEHFITLEIADGVRVKVLRTAIASSVQALASAAVPAGGKA